LRAGEQIEATASHHPCGWDAEHLLCPPSPPPDVEARANHKYGVTGSAQDAEARSPTNCCHHRRGFLSTAERATSIGVVSFLPPGVAFSPNSPSDAPPGYPRALPRV